jgi:hypothetical protein
MYNQYSISQDRSVWANKITSVHAKPCSYWYVPDLIPAFKPPWPCVTLCESARYKPIDTQDVWLKQLI